MTGKFHILYLSAIFLCLSQTGNAIHAQQKSDEWPRGVTYEIFVQSFADSDGNGKGDIKGMTAKLDYLKNLGVEAVWLMPISPSPSYHKYNVTDYYGIHPDYGTLEDFKEFIKQAHRRNIKVVIDLVINHSGRTHPWFQDALKNPDSPYRDYYVWAHKDDSKTKVEGKIIAGDSDNKNRWIKAEGSNYLYYAYFGGSMPDLNYDNPKLREEIFEIGRFWLTEVGVDGFRLDAARHIFPEERANDNHSWWVDFKNEMQKAKKDVYLVGEVWAQAEVVAPYMKGLPALFNFDMGRATIKAINESNGEKLIENHEKIREFYKSVNPDYIDAVFLTNHDQNRIMSAVNNDINKAKLAASILLTLPGSPYLYYGEEIGMKGKKPDEHIREPFLWQPKEKDVFRTSWIQPRYSRDSTVRPLSVQLKDKNSIYNRYKELLRLRKGSKALRLGEIESVDFNKNEICAFLRISGRDTLLVVHNLSDQNFRITLPANLKQYKRPVFHPQKSGVKNLTLRLLPYESLILKK